MERRDVLALRDVVLQISKDDNSLALVENVAAGLPVPNRAVRPRPLLKRGQLVDGVFAAGQFDHFAQGGNPRRRFARANHPGAQSQNQT